MSDKVDIVKKAQEWARQLRERINPIYATTRGTESFEREQSAKHISALVAELRQVKGKLARLRHDTSAICVYSYDQNLEPHATTRECEHVIWTDKQWADHAAGEQVSDPVSPISAEPILCASCDNWINPYYGKCRSCS